MQVVAFPNGMSRKILIVDDDPSVCATMKYILDRAGNEVQTTLSASEALSLAQKDQFDLLISDLVMPEQDGIELNSQNQKCLSSAADRCDVRGRPAWHP